MLDYRDYPELSAELIHAHPMDDPRFEPWLEAWYDAPMMECSWKREPKDVAFHPDKETFAVLVTRSWSMGHTLVERFGIDPVGQTVWNLSNACSWPSRPERGGRMMWDAVDTLFEEVFVPFANDSLCHLSEPCSEIGAALYMFWDFSGWFPHTNDEVEAGLPHLVRLLHRSLQSSKASVQESAIHGIGEFVNRGHFEVKELARRFIAEGQTSRPELFDYADAAAMGKIP